MLFISRVIFLKTVHFEDLLEPPLINLPTSLCRLLGSHPTLPSTPKSGGESVAAAARNSSFIYSQFAYGKGYGSSVPVCLTPDLDGAALNEKGLGELMIIHGTVRPPWTQLRTGCGPAWRPEVCTQAPRGRQEGRRRQTDLPEIQHLRIYSMC